MQGGAKRPELEPHSATGKKGGAFGVIELPLARDLDLRAWAHGGGQRVVLRLVRSVDHDRPAIVARLDWRHGTTVIGMVPVVPFTTAVMAPAPVAVARTVALKG